MLCSAENSPCRVGTRQSRSVIDQSLGWRRSCSHESQTPRHAYTGKDCPIPRHNPNLLGPPALSCTSRAAQHSRCFALQWLACVRMATSAQLLHQTNWLPCLIGWLRCWQQLLPWPQVLYPSSACAYRWAGRRLEELQGGTGRVGKSGSSSRPAGHAVFVHAYRPRSPSSSSPMHHERMAHILSPEVLRHPSSLLTRATCSRRFGVCSL